MSILQHLMQRAIALDASDPLAGQAAEFVDDNDLIYLDGNSLGRLPKATVALMNDLILRQWGSRLIRSWNESWIDLPGRIAAKIAQLVGAGEDEIFVGDSTSVNLYKLAYGVLQLQSGRKTILSDELNFPSDFYVLQGLAHGLNKGHQLHILPSADGIAADIGLLRSSMNKDTALVCLSHVAFRTAYMYDMAEVNAIAAENGAMVIWDLSHAVGSVPVQLREHGAQLAVGCTYKYINGGPGAPAFLYVAREMQEKLSTPIWAWFGHAQPFAFAHEYAPRPGIWKYAAGTPPVLSLAAIEPGLDLLLGAGIHKLRAKSLSLSELFLEAYHAVLQPLGFKMASPYTPLHRGSHIALRHPEGYRICQALIQPHDKSRPIIPDFRQPDIIRFGFAPLYNTHREIVETAARLAEIIENRSYLEYDPNPAAVT
ncbi:MAG: kynureninase [Bacteroidetes bacterium]|nr:kynureninase [Bacteroidota bacterium]